MSDALVIIVLLGSDPGEPPAGPWVPAMLLAARQALGPESTVLVDTSDTTTDDGALALTLRMGARAVVRVRWADGRLTRAHLHVHVATWVDDDLTFRAEDPASEKGRSVGYAIATMVQRLHREEPPAPPSSAPPPPMPAAPAPAPVRVARTDLDILATGVVAVGAPSVGGALGVRVWPTSVLGLRMAAGARVGRVEEANVDTTTLFLAGGPGVRVPIGTGLELGARTDVMLLRVSASRESDATGRTVRSRILGAFDAHVEAAWTVAAPLALTAAVGTEIAFGPTDVRVGGVRTADIPPVRGVFELGGRFRF